MRILLILLFITSQVFAQESRRLEVLFLGDNKHHRPIERVPQLMEALGPKGINFTYTDKLEDLNPTTLAKYDALMIYANWDVLSPEAEKALLDFVAMFSHRAHRQYKISCPFHVFLSKYTAPFAHQVCHLPDLL